MTLPYEREKIFLDDIIDDCLKGRNKFVLVIAPSHQQIAWFVKHAILITEDLKLKKSVRLFREAIEFDNGAIINFMTKDNPSAFRGIKPDRICIVGEWAEFWYLIMSTGAPIEAIA